MGKIRASLRPEFRSLSQINFDLRSRRGQVPPDQLCQVAQSEIDRCTRLPNIMAGETDLIMNTQELLILEDGRVPVLAHQQFRVRNR